MADGTRDERVVHRAELVIVGAGAAGATAALEAYDAGASFVALDQLPEFGGTAITSGGGTCIAGSAKQRAMSINDSPELALRDLLATGLGEADEAWARFYFEHSAHDVYDWVVDRGVEYVNVRLQENNAVPRWHFPKNSGRGLMLALWGALQERGLADCWHFGMTADDLLWENGRVVGVLAHDQDGREHEFRGGAIIMATGGFNGNLDMVLEYAPHLRAVGRVLAGGGVGALGGGHRILERHGALLTHMGNVFSYCHATPDYKDPKGARGLVIRSIDDNIWVCRDGRRFHDEHQHGANTATWKLLEQDPQICWAIVDRAMVEQMDVSDPYYRRGSEGLWEKVEELLRESPYIAQGNTPEELARNAGLDVANFVQTFNEWNALLASGAETDPLTGRHLKDLKPFVQPPYYAIQFYPLARKNLGGVRTDLQCHVLTPNDQPIPGLYAAGELCGMAGGHIAGKRALEGIMIGGSLFSGRVAGAWAAHELGHREPTHLDARRPAAATAG